MFLLKDTTQWRRWGSNPSVSSQALYHWATALPNGMIGQEGGGGGAMSKCSKTIYYKNLSGTYFVQTCRQISIYNGMYQGFSYEGVQSN